MDEFKDDTEIIDSTKAIEPCWPFWGLLETIESAYPSQIKIDNVICYIGLESDIFGRFSQIANQSLGMLKHRDIDELRISATAIQAEIEEWYEYYIEQETEAYVQNLFHEGGWELNYLSRDSSYEEAEYAGHPIPVSKDEIRYLLENWSSEWDNKPSLPSRDDLSELEALQECLNFANFNQSELIHFDLIEPEEHEFFAILALMIICDAVHSNPRTKIEHYWQEPTLSQVKAIGHASINAVEAMAHAQRVQLEQKIRKSIALKQPEILAKELSRRTSERAVNAANKKHLATNAARDWVCKEWLEKRDGYAGNKSEFARSYVVLVRNQFTDSKGDPLSVTEKTIREVWLKDTPAAGK
jgi:hypothetical protein